MPTTSVSGGDLRASQAPNQFFRLAGKHRAGDYFHPSGAGRARMFFAGGNFVFVWFNSAAHRC
jgi:hypothetical protein